MTSPVRAMSDDAFVPDPERLLEAYAASVRIVASPQLMRRLHQSVAEERAVADAGLAGRVAALAGRGPRRTAGRSARADLDRRPAAGTLLRLPSLALLLLLLLSVGAAVGGAGAMMISVLEGRHDGSLVPTQLVAPQPAEPTGLSAPGPATIRDAALLRGPLTRVTERPDAVPGPILRVSIHPQRRPASGHRRALVRWRAQVAAAREARRASVGSLGDLSGGQGRVGCHEPTGEGLRGEDDLPSAVDVPRAGALVLPRSHTGVCAF